ncbi:MAG TPA: hypothetical protein VF733_02315 [Candidatus Saccharimonadales bacterium]
MTHQLLDRPNTGQPLPPFSAGNALPLNDKYNAFDEIVTRYNETAEEPHYPRLQDRSSAPAIAESRDTKLSLVEKAKAAYAKIGQYALVKLTTGVNPFKAAPSEQSGQATTEVTENSETREKGWLLRNLRVGAAAVQGAMPFLQAALAIKGIHFGSGGSGNGHNTMASMNTNHSNAAHNTIATPSGGHTAGASTREIADSRGNGNAAPNFSDTEKNNVSLLSTEGEGNSNVPGSFPGNGNESQPGGINPAETEQKPFPIPTPFETDSKPDTVNEAKNHLGDVWTMPEYKGPNDSVEKLATDQLKSAFEANGLDPNQVSGEQVHDVVDAFMKQNNISNDRMMQVGDYQMIDFKGKIHDIVDLKVKEHNAAIMDTLTPFSLDENTNTADTTISPTSQNQPEGPKTVPAMANVVGGNANLGEENTTSGTSSLDTGDKPKFMTTNITPDYEPEMIPVEDKANGMGGIVPDQWEMPAYNGPDDSVETLARRHLRATLAYNRLDPNLATPEMVQQMVDAFKQQNHVTNDRMMQAGTMFDMTNFKKELHDITKQALIDHPPKTIGARLNHEPISVLTGEEQNS